MIPIGTYKARGGEGVFGETKRKGTEFVAVPFRVDAGEHEGTTVPWRGYFTENTTQRTIESLRAAGCIFPNNDIRDLTGLGSTVVEIVVEHEEWQNDQGEMKMRARVAWVNSGGGGVSEEERMSESKLASFASRMKGALIASGKSSRSSSGGRNGAAPAQLQAPQTSAHDDDIPF